MLRVKKLKGVLEIRLCSSIERVLAEYGPELFSERYGYQYYYIIIAILVAIISTGPQEFSSSLA